MSARTAPVPLSANLAIERSKWKRQTKSFMKMGLESSSTGEKRFRQGWVEILRELFPGPHFSIAPLSYKERNRVGADYEIDIVCVCMLQVSEDREYGRPMLFVEQKAPEHIKKPGHRAKAQLQIKHRFGWMKRKYLDPPSTTDDVEYRQIPRIHALSAYGWQFAHYAMNLDTGLTFPASINPPPLRQWKYSAVMDDGYNVLWSIRDELVLAAHNAGANTGIILSPAHFGECAPKFKNDQGEFPPSVDETVLRGLEDGAFDEDAMSEEDSDDPDYQPPEDLADKFGDLSTGPVSSSSTPPSRASQNRASSLRRTPNAPQTPGGILREHFIQTSTEISSSGSAYATSLSSSSGYGTGTSTPSPSAPVTPPSHSRAISSRTTPLNQGSSQGWNDDSSSDDGHKRRARTPIVPRYHNAWGLDVSPTERLSTVRATPLGRYQGDYRARPSNSDSSSPGGV